MDKYELKRRVSETVGGRYYFSRATMKFFGDTMANYGVRRAKIMDMDGQKREVYELYRRRPVKHGLNKSAYFDVDTFKRVHTLITY